MVSPRPTDEASSQATQVEPDSRRSGETLPPTRGATIDRYVILDRIGAGGMGVVYAAYDPDLDRKVAIKLILPSGEHGSSTAGRARMLREAQALARLAHPNVVTIHDVGTLDDQVWIAMEFVAGQTLSAWLEQARPWPEVLDVLIAAGWGLASAHAAGLLHRDLKPDNVMITPQLDSAPPRVRVMDFGLARADEVGRTECAETLASDGALAVHVTRAGALIGTPAYMAPELFEGASATAASDQFGFCVTLWEALYGQRPFAGSSAIELATAVLEQRPSASDRPVPAWLRRVVERGLAIDPAQRWPSINDLLDALAAGKRRARLRRPMLVAIALAAVAGVAALGQLLRERADRSACAEAGRAIEALWPGRADTLAQAFEHSPITYAGETLTHLRPWLDDNVARWRDARTQLCIDERIEHGFEAALREQAQVCLLLSERRLGALLDGLREVEPAALRQAIVTASDLDPPERCVDPRALATHSWPSTEQVEAVATLEATLSRITILFLGNEIAAALELGERAIVDADALGWAPLVARARTRQGRRLSDRDRHAEGEALLREAYFIAVRASAWLEAADAASSLLVVVGRQGRSDEARTWARHAIAMLELAGLDAGLQRAGIDAQLSVVERNAGALDEAGRLAWRSLETMQQLLGPDHPLVAESHERIGNAYLERGDNEAALEHHRRALAIREAALGPDHPDIGSNLGNIAIVEHALGNDDEAIRLCERAIAIEEATPGPRSTTTVGALSTLASVYRDRGRYPEAVQLLRRVLALETEVLGREHFEVGATMLNLAGALDNSGQRDEALGLIDEALAICERTLPPDHPQLGLTFAVRGHVLHNLDRLAESEASYLRALDVLRRAEAPQPGALPLVWASVAELQRKRGHFDEAERTIARALVELRPSERGPVTIEAAELAVARARPHDAIAMLEPALADEELAPVIRGRIGFALARALLADARRDDAIARARDALALLRRHTARPEELAKLEAWLARESGPK